MGITLNKETYYTLFFMFKLVTSNFFKTKVVFDADSKKQSKNIRMFIRIDIKVQS